MSTNPISNCALDEIARHIKEGKFSLAVRLIDSLEVGPVYDFRKIIMVVSELLVGEDRDLILAHLIPALVRAGRFESAQDLPKLFSTGKGRETHEEILRRAMLQRMESAVG
jgi:hypothetical protein